MAAGWPGRGLVLVGVLAGCGGQALTPLGAPRTETPPVGSTPAAPTTVDAGGPPRSVDAAGTRAPVVQRARRSVLTSAPLWNAEVLAADDDGIYWVTSDNRLWILPAWSDTARVLAADPNPPGGVLADDDLLVRGNYILWSTSVVQAGSASRARPLHRTSKEGADVVMFADAPPLPAADAGHLYYLQGDVDHADLAIAALPLDARPGETPVTLTAIPSGRDVSALAVDDQRVYWTECAVGSTMFEATGPIFRGDKASLPAGGSSGSELVGLNAYLLAPFTGGLYFAFAPSPGSGEVGVLEDVNRAPSILPLPPGSSLVAFDSWVVSSTAEAGRSDGKIYAVAAGSVAGDGQVAVEIADDALVPPVAGLPGLVFVDSSGHLVAVSASDLGAAVAAGQR